MREVERQSALSAELLGRLSEFLARHTGLDFTGPRRADLERGMQSLARRSGSADVHAYVADLLAGPLTHVQIEELAAELTVGETYFFREKEALAALAQAALPALLVRPERRVRIWSAGCSTGEEAYSLAITLARNIPDLREWNVSILATDINAQALHKAALGIYGEWSFRSTPPEVRRAFFRRTADARWQVGESLRRLVTFGYLNLAEDCYPSLANGTNGMDVIFCRNVLMYFEPARARRVLETLARCLVPGGWLFLNPIEVSRLAVAELTVVEVAGTIAYRKRGARTQAAALPPLGPTTIPTLRPPTIATLSANRESPAPRAGATGSRPAEDAASFARFARLYANQGRLAEAQEWCEKAVAADKLNPASHYLLAMILQERGMGAQCEAALRRALYLDPNHALAHFALGNLRRHEGRQEQSRRHLNNALSALAAYASDDVLPEADGMSAGRLAEIVRATLADEVAQ